MILRILKNNWWLKILAIPSFIYIWLLMDEIVGYLILANNTYVTPGVDGKIAPTVFGFWYTPLGNFLLAIALIFPLPHALFSFKMRKDLDWLDKLLYGITLSTIIIYIFTWVVTFL